jgi:hypothetical protein
LRTFILQDDFKKAQDERIDTFKKAFKGMIATSEAAYQKTNSKFVRTRRDRVYSKDDIRRIVEEGNPIERAALSEYFFATNGLYKRIILHYATFLTYSWILVPYPKSPIGKTNIAEK